MSAAAGSSSLAKQNIIDIMTGGWKAQALYTAVKLNLPSLIEAGHVTSHALGEATDAKEVGIRRLMRLLILLGVFEGDHREGYRNTATSEMLLGDRSSLADMCLLYGEECYLAWWHAHDAIVSQTPGFKAAFGTGLYEYLGRNTEVAQRFQNVMNAGSMFFCDVAGLIDLSGGKMVVDVGGGGGELLGTILQATPDARGTFFDREHMLPKARQVLARMQCSDRVTFIGGDMTAGVPRGGDLYLCSRIFAGWSDDVVRSVLTSCRSGMTGTTSRVMIFDWLIRENDPSLKAALWDLQLLMTIGGGLRSLETFSQALSAAGMEVERTAELPNEMTAIIARPY